MVNKNCLQFLKEKAQREGSNILSSICDVGSDRAATGDHSCLKQRGTRVQLAPSKEDSGMHLEHAARRGGCRQLSKAGGMERIRHGVRSPCPHHTPAAKIVSLWTQSALSLGALVKRQLLKERIGQKSRCSRILTLFSCYCKAEGSDPLTGWSAGISPSFTFAHASSSPPSMHNATPREKPVFLG